MAYDAGCARLAEVVDEGLESWPRIFVADYRQSLILTEVSQEYVIVFVL